MSRRRCASASNRRPSAGGATGAWREVASLHHGAPEFVGEAEKYEGGMLPSALLYAMEASVGMILELGPAAIEQRAMRLAGYARDRPAPARRASAIRRIPAFRFAGGRRPLP